MSSPNRTCRLILGRSSYRRLLAALQELLAGITGPDRQTVATRLARYLLWEFEDYQEYDPRRRGG
ncbi:MAG TPA: Imm8 family immunity protein [Dehalococcoidia bacterium]